MTDEQKKHRSELGKLIRDYILKNVDPECVFKEIDVGGPVVISYHPKPRKGNPFICIEITGESHDCSNMETLETNLEILPDD